MALNQDMFNIVSRNLSNLIGKRIKGKVVVFESDDWGSIRMPSKESFSRLEEAGLDLRSADAERFNLNDTLGTSEDLVKLFEVLSRHKDGFGNYAVFTPITIVANPIFDKIKESGFKEYYYEPFTTTLIKYKDCEQSFKLWKQGIENKLFLPQMHGREHLNVTAWIDALQAGDKFTMLAFTEGMWGFVPPKYPYVDYQAAFLFSDKKELEYQKTVIIDGLELFEKIFGYKAEYFVPPNGPFNNSLNRVLVEQGIRYRSTSKFQIEPIGNGKTKKVLHYLGQKDSSGITYITRNCFFEPNQYHKDWIDSCLFDIKVAFNLNKPAIISSHRTNYIGALYPENRDNGIRQLDLLLKAIMKSWPDVRFMTTPEIGKLINENPK